MPPAILGRGRAVGKVILFGEHAVVYGRPALAVPVTQVWAEAIVARAPLGFGLAIHAADLGEEIAVRDAPADHPLAAAVRLALAAISHQPSAISDQFPASSFQTEPDWRITIRSTIPIASGMGSGAAVSAAIVRAVIDAANQRIGESANRKLQIANCKSQIANCKSQIGNTQYAIRNTPYAIRNTQYAITPDELSALTYDVEKLHHGTPSGIDNTVIAFGRPVYFVRGRAPEPFAIGRPFTLVIGDTGIRSSTKVAVGDVRAAWEQDRARFEAFFDQVAAIVEAARNAIAAGQPDQLGPLMDENHALLQQIGVSCPELDALVAAARTTGALGAKLSGAGRGGNMIALATEETAAPMAAALTAAGAARVIVTRVGTTDDR